MFEGDIVPRGFNFSFKLPSVTRVTFNKAKGLVKLRTNIEFHSASEHSQGIFSGVVVSGKDLGQFYMFWNCWNYKYIFTYHSFGKSDRGVFGSGRSPDPGAWSGRSPDHALNNVSVQKYDWTFIKYVRSIKNPFNSDRFYEKLWNLPKLLYLIM